MRALESWSESDYYESHVQSLTPDGSTLVGARAIDRFYIPGGDVNFSYDHAFRWTDGEGLVPLFRASGPEFTSFANDVSDDGSIIVGSIHSPRATPQGSVSATYAFVWRADGSHQFLDGLGGDQRTFANALAISGDGSTVIGDTISTSSRRISFVWTSDRGTRPLSDGADALDVYARDVSFDGSLIVGSVYSRTGGTQAFIWNADRGVVPLNDYLESLGVDLGGWSMINAVSVLADGRTIFGSALDPNGDYVLPYFAVIPEPVPAVLIGLGLIGFLAVRRQPQDSV